MFFKIPEVDAKYKNLNEGADPIVSVAIGYKGKLSEVPLPIADKLFADGAHIDLKDKPASIKTNGNTVVDMAKKNGLSNTDAKEDGKSSGKEDAKTRPL